MDYETVKIVHVTAAALSFVGFFSRGLGALAGAAWVRTQAARSIPHVVDTVLLAAAVTLAWKLRLAPTAAPWLMAKIVAVVVYIALGTVALRRETPKSMRITTWLAALAVFAYIVSTAITKDPFAFFRTGS